MERRFFRLVEVRTKNRSRRDSTFLGVSPISFSLTSLPLPRLSTCAKNSVPRSVESPLNASLLLEVLTRSRERTKGGGEREGGGEEEEEEDEVLFKGGGGRGARRRWCCWRCCCCCRSAKKRCGGGGGGRGHCCCSASLGERTGEGSIFFPRGKWGEKTMKRSSSFSSSSSFVSFFLFFLHKVSSSSSLSFTL